MKYFIILTLTIYISCKKTSLSVDNVIYGLQISNHDITADGTTIDTIIAKINNAANVSKRFVTFQTNSGNFINGSNGMISVPALFENNELVARAFIIAPLKATVLKITASPKLDSSNANYVLKDSIVVNSSEPASIHLEVSGYGIKPNYQGEITMSAILKNSEGNNVSLGNKVEFKDTMLTSGAISGDFRQINNISDSSSKTSCIYSIPNVPVGTKIKLKVAIINTQITDSTFINVIQ